MQKLRLTLLFVLFALIVQAQDNSFKGQLLENQDHPTLQKKFKSYQIYTIDAPSLFRYIQSEPESARLTLDLGEEHDWDLLLAPSNILGPDYQLRIQTANGVEVADRNPNKAFNGYVQGAGGGTTALTVDENFIYGFIQKNNEVYYIEPLSYLIGDEIENAYVVYAESAVIKDSKHKCGADELAENKARALQRKNQIVAENENDTRSSIIACYDIDIALASDFSMVTKYGSVAGAENHNIGVLNNVNTNYDDEFNHSLTMVIVAHFISDCNSCDPWTASTDPGVLLNSFRSWGNGGGFGATYDVASHWSNRNFDGSTVGLAWVGVICSSFRYNVLQDFSSTAWRLRVLQSHELGHNFDANHDGSGSNFIMAPSINNSNTWSAASIASINAHVQNRINSGCVTPCASGVPPVADFTSNIQNGCAELTVDFIDNSTDATGWSWTFEGGVPGTSTDQNPTVNYPNQGTFDVTLEVSNAFGNNSITQTDYIFVDDIPSVSFTQTANELIVDFTNTSNNATSYSWDFGDGNTSTDENPTHIYGDDGEYVVTLEATNTCGTNFSTEVITVVSIPFALFVSDLTSGCAPLSIQFASQSSSNVTTWSWTFPGGTPASSSAEDPSVVYDTPGFYDVELTVSNAAGSDTYTELGYIEVLPVPTAGFTYVINNDVDVVFTNTSTNADSYTWDFGDGTSSTEENPSHTYATAGSYNVVLIVENPCGAPSITITIEIVPSVPPVADFQGDVLFGCVPLIVEFEDLSTNATSWAWTFPGGAPATSTNEDPKITYNEAGIYDVTLIATNASGSDTVTFVNYITVEDVPDADFIATANGASVDFSNTTTNGDSFVWDFGDGNSSTDENPNNIYAMDGTYTVQLIATNGCGNDTTDQEVIVILPPVADFNADVTSGCADLTVNFMDQSTGATAWAWIFSGATPATSADQNPTVVYDTEGTYTVELTVTNTSGNNTITQTNYITVNDVPNVGFNTTQTGNDVDFNNSTTNADSYAWDFGDGNTSTDENPSNTYPDDGTYTVTLTATNGCGSVTVEEDITISTAPTAAFTSDVTSGCAELTVIYTDQSSLNATSWAWTFEGGNPATSTAQNPTVNYDAAGTYDVTLTVANVAGNNTNTETNYITVTDVPVADFTSSINGSTVDFTNASTNADTYSWDFGDGNNSTATNPSHTYGMDGTYEVELTATNDCGSVSTTETIVISNEPTADFGSDATSGCADLTVNYMDSSSANAVNWAWTFEGGNPATSSAENPTVVYGTAGTYDVTLTVTNAAGESNTITETNYITVNDVPVADFNSTVNGMAVDFDNTSTNADSYAWDFGDGNTSTSTNPTNDYAMDGTYTVELIASNDCGSNTTTQTVVISNPPTADFGSDATSGCADLTVNYMDSSSANAVTWAWTFEGGNPASSTAENPTVVYGTAGTYDVTLTVTNAAGVSNTTTETNYISVDDLPTADFTSATNGLTADFDNTSTNADSYDWNFGDGNTSTATNPSNNYASDGTYTVTLIATNDCGSVTTTETITITTAPVADFIANVTSGCAPLTVTFTDASSPNTTEWDWSFQGGTPATSGDQSPTIVFNTPGVYTVSLEASNTAGSNTFTQTAYITVLAAPTADFSSTVTGTLGDFNNNSANANSYSWDFGDGNTSTSENPSNNYATDGTYTVTLTATGDCGTDVTTQTVTIVTTPIADFTADLTQGCAPLTVNFTDLSSANTTIWSWTFAGGTPTTSFDQNPTVTYNTPGVYTVVLEVGNTAGTNTITRTNYIVVDAAPTASFTSTVAGTSVSFNNTSTNATSYGWNFGDGGTSSGTNPSHIYGADGTYTVTLTATNDCGAVTTTETVVISTDPVAGFSANPTSGCGPLSVSFTDDSSPNTTSWLWTFEGGTPGTSADQNPTVVFENPGSYGVTLVATSSAGNSTFMQSNYITVFGTPNASFTSSTNGTTTTFSNTTTSGNSYSWAFGDGNSSTDPNPEHTYGTDGTYTVILTATNDCGSTTATETVTIVTAPIAGFTADVTSGCTPMTVNFMDQSSANTTGWLWTFEGGTPATSTDQNPIVTYGTAGVYSVTLEVSNAAGTNTAAETSYILVEEGPTAGFGSTQLGTTQTFNNSSTNGNTYLWDFGDGNNSTMENPSHTYTMTGTYTVVLTTTNDCGSVTATEVVSITVTSAPVAGFTADVLSGCAPLTVNYTDQSSANTTSWLWTFEGGTPATSTDQNPQVLYDQLGNYNVTLTATNATGDNTATQNSFIQITESAPLSAFNSSTADATVTFDNGSTGATTYAWTFGDGNTSTMENPTHTYQDDGTYEVILIVTNNCGTSETSETVVIATLPNAGFSMDVNAGCGPLTVNFADASSNNTDTWAWTFPGGTPATSADQNPSVTYDASGTYDVTLVVTNAQGMDTEVQMNGVTVDLGPSAGFMASGAGLTIDFTNTATGATTYAWTFGDGGTSMDADPSHTYTSGGDFDVQLIVMNDCGSDTTAQVVTIGGAAPTAAFIGMPGAGCVPLEVEFEDQSTGATTWAWTLDGGSPAASSEQNPLVVYDTPGTYPVTLSVTNAFGSNSLTQVGYIVVGEAPTAGFTSVINMGTVDLTNTSTGADTYAWDFGDGETSSDESPSHTYTANGNYTITLSVTNDCGTTTWTEDVTAMITSTTLPEAVSAFNFYPNPNNGSFYLEIEAAPTKVLQVQLYDIIGRKMMNEQFDFNSGQLSHRFEMTHLAAGTYVLQLVIGDDVLVRKVVVE
jgi:PKD repeat protein